MRRTTPLFPSRTQTHPQAGADDDNDDKKDVILRITGRFLLDSSQTLTPQIAHSTEITSSIYTKNGSQAAINSENVIKKELIHN